MVRGSTDRNHISAFDRTFHFIPSACAGRDWNLGSGEQRNVKPM